MRRSAAAATTAAVLAMICMFAGVAHAAERSAGSRADWTAPGSGVSVVPGGTLIGMPAPSHVGGGSTPVTGAGGVNPDVKNRHGKLIEISEARQHLWAWVDGRVVMSFPISTGRAGYRTPTGHFRVRAKGLNWWSSQWRVWMPYAMNFYRNYNLHSLPYYPGSKHLIGASTLGKAASHGCVRIGPSNARALYAWSPVGTPVWIH